MRSRMPAAAYLSHEWFARERELLFRKLWLFAGLKTMLGAHNAFVTRDVCGIPVVLQNFNGELRAFENICLHRGAKLQWESAGRRPLLCRYHGWGYDQTGAPANIPLEKELYRFPGAEREGMHLREFPLREVGNLVFINMSPNPLPFEQQFGQALIDSLEASSASFDGEVMTTTWAGRFNWKLAYENLRDANHPRFVHPQSLAKTVDFVPRVDEVLAAEANAELERPQTQAARRTLLQRFSSGGPDAPLDSIIPYGWRNMVTRWGSEDSYFNWLVYPNLHIASGDGGYSFTIEHHVPVAPDLTDLEIYWMTAKKRKPYAYSSTVLLALMHGSKLVVGEDVRVMESVQEGLHEAAPRARQGAFESANRLIERWYVDLMESGGEI